MKTNTEFHIVLSSYPHTNNTKYIPHVFRLYFQIYGHSLLPIHMALFPSILINLTDFGSRVSDNCVKICSQTEGATVELPLCPTEVEGERLA